MRKNTLVRTGFLVAVSLLVAACGAAAAETPGGSPAPGGPLKDRSSSSFVGLSVEEAAARATEQGRAWRVIREDGVDLVVTDDYLEDRVNLTVANGAVTAAVTDAEIVAAASGGPSCRHAVPVVDEGDVIGLVDLDDDGRDEILAVIHASGVAEIGVWTRDETCSLHRVTLDGAPAVLAVGLTESIAAGVSCRPGYVDDLYFIELASRDGGTWYTGRIAAYNLEGSELVEAPGEGAEYPGEDVAEVAVLACGDVTYP